VTAHDVFGDHQKPPAPNAFQIAERACAEAAPQSPLSRHRSLERPAAA